MHSAFAKSAVNCFLSGNYLPLTLNERLHFTAASDIDRFHVPASAIPYAATRSPTTGYRILSKLHKHANIELLNVYKYNVINYTKYHRKPISQNNQFSFISDIVAGKNYNETAFYRQFKEGKSYSRSIPSVGEKPGRTRLTLQSEEDFAVYYQSCLSLIDSIRKNGLLDLEHGEPSDELRAVRETFGEKRGSTIGVVIDDAGTLLHRGKGHHRIAVAHLLDIDRITVAVNCISAAYFRAFSSRTDLMSEARFKAAVHAAAGAAISKHQ